MQQESGIAGENKDKSSVVSKTVVKGSEEKMSSEEDKTNITYYNKRK